MIHRDNRYIKLFSMLSFYYFLFFAIIGNYVIIFPKYLTTIGFSTWEIGIIFASMPIARFLFPFIYFRRTLSKNDYLLSISISMMAPLLLLSQNLYLIILSLFLIGGGFSIAFPYVEAIAIEKLGNRYGKSRLFGSIGFIVVGISFSYMHINPVYLFIGLISMLSLCGLYFLNDNTITFNNEPLDLMRYWWFWAMLILVEISFGGYYDFFTIYNLNHGISKENIGWIWVIGSLAEIFIFILQYKFISIFPPMSWVKLSVFITSFRWLILYLFPGNLEVVILVQILQAISFAIFHTANLIFINQIYENKTLAQQFYAGIAYGLAEFSGSIIAGLLFNHYLFLFESLFALAGFIILVYGSNKMKIKSN